ncbi:Glycoside hydrolase family 29 protein [Mycena kentingensis (nom. inval.)]|nr:Glycoside hydrolase family 29 protein [Mycena kentingensis (nom. inval.)]
MRRKGLLLIGPLVRVVAGFPLSNPLPLAPLFNNLAASPDGIAANFDAHGGSFDSRYLPSGPEWVHDGISYAFPTNWGTAEPPPASDNVIASGQVLALDEPTYVHELHMVYAGDPSGSTHEFVATFALNFEDNTTQQLQLYAKNWWRWPILNWGVIRTPYSYQNPNNLTSPPIPKNFNQSQIYQWSSAVPSEARLVSVTLPALNNARRLHLFAMSITPCAATPQSSPALAIRRARFTNRWEDVGGRTRAQAVAVTLANLLPTASGNASGAALKSPHTIELAGGGISTVQAGVVNRLVPGDQARVDVLIAADRGAGDESSVEVIVKDSRGMLVLRSALPPGTEMSEFVQSWTPDVGSLEKHETPTWWNKAKFGIFIHWGVYSVPAWAPPSQYAEWYDFYMRTSPQNASNPTWAHHLATYGSEIDYEDFVRGGNFTASKWDPAAWVDLFADAGARYFVLVTKHHDGFALFDTGTTTNRSSLNFGPRRDLVKELLDTAKERQPQLHRGTYYSLPEWFNPDYAKYGFGQWPGGAARDAFNSSIVEPYTGWFPVKDYITDLQLPHMLALAERYDTDIMWCDIGGENRTLEFAAQFYNHAFRQGRQVTMNNRCGNVPDFETPEYATFGSIQPTSWESSEGMDPFSYGLNTATSAAQYKNGTTIVQTLVDIVSKNGNFLLDVGPTAEGEIIEPMVRNLRDAGEWLAYSGRCVYDTDYWFQGAQDASPPAGAPAVRFLTTPSTLCIVAFALPADGMLEIDKRVPLLPGDELALLTPEGRVVVPWVYRGEGGEGLVLNVTGVSGGRFAWAFEAVYKLE